MKNKFNKIVCVSLAAILTVGATALPTILAKENLPKQIVKNNEEFLAKTPTPDNFFTFDEATGTIELYDINGPKDVVIPEEINGVKVKIIGDYAFRYRQLTSLVIPEGVETIGEFAINSNNFASINIPSTVKSIGTYAFGNNPNLTSVTIPGNVKLIKSNAFASNDKLASVTMEEGVETIGFEAFARCKVLNTVNIPSTVTTIGEKAFLPLSSSPLRPITININQDKLGNPLAANAPWGAVINTVNWKSYRLVASILGTGRVEFNKPTAIAGETVKITTTPGVGYELDKITVTDASGANVPVTGNSFTMPADNVTVAVTFKAIDYNVTVSTDANGTASVDKDTANVGETVTITTTPNAGYELDKITVTDASGANVTVTGNSFTMPADNVAVAVTFKAIDYNVIINPLLNGQIEADKLVANVGETVTLTINADEGYQLKEGTLKVITASGIEIPLTQIARMTNGTFTFEMPAENVMLFADFTSIVIPPVVEPEKPQPPIEETKPETGKNPITGTAGLAGILGAMGLAGATTLFTRKRKNK